MNQILTPLDLVLSKVEAKKHADYWMACCPAHEDSTASLMLKEDETDRHAIVHCFAGCERATVCESIGIKEQDLYIPERNYRSIPTKKKLTLADLSMDKCIRPEILDECGLRNTDWNTPKGKVYKDVIRIPYYNLDGTEHGARIRTALKAKEGTYAEKDGISLLPYGLQYLTEAKDFLVIPEGETDWLTLRQHTIAALSIPGATNAGCLKAEHIELFPDQVYVIQENDDAGTKFPKKVAERLKALGYIGNVFVVDLFASHGVKDPNELHQKLHRERRTDAFTFEFQKAMDAAKEVGKGESGTLENIIDPNEDASQRPRFLIGGQMRDQVKKALRILREHNTNNPKFFIYLSLLSEVARDENSNPIVMQLERAALRNALNEAADFFKIKETRNGESEVPAHPPKDLAEQILALAPGEWKFPVLKGIVEAPVLRPDGSVLQTPGYDDITKLFYVPSAGMEKCNVPDKPSEEDVSKAIELIKSIFQDFPFEGKADKANAYALLCTPFIRHAVTKDIQMALIDATNAGSGKGLIASIVSIAATGKPTTPMDAKGSTDEWRKAILTELLKAPRIVVIDNIRGVLESTTLELMLTGGGINERILGQSKSAQPKNEATWIATGNNLLIGGDLPRRCYRIRLISETATPEERDDFKIKDLEQWAIDHRHDIVSAILTIARAWYVAGKPQSKKVPNLGSFSNWAKTVGSILEFAGVEGFQENRDELRSKNNEEAREWEAFLATWSRTYSTWIPAQTIANAIVKENEQYSATTANAKETTANTILSSLPLYLKKALAEKPKSFAVILAQQLGKRVQTVYGNKKTGEYRLEKKIDPHTKNNEWKVIAVVCGGPSPSRMGKNSLDNEESWDSNENSMLHIAYDAVEPPQTTANGIEQGHIDLSNMPSDGSAGCFVEYLPKISETDFAVVALVTKKEEARTQAKAKGYPRHYYQYGQYLEGESAYLKAIDIASDLASIDKIEKMLKKDGIGV